MCIQTEHNKNSENENLLIATAKANVKIKINIKKTGNTASDKFSIIG